MSSIPSIRELPRILLGVLFIALMFYFLPARPPTG